MKGVVPGCYISAFQTCQKSNPFWQLMLILTRVRGSGIAVNARARTPCHGSPVERVDSSPLAHDMLIIIAAGEGPGILLQFRTRAVPFEFSSLRKRQRYRPLRYECGLESDWFCQNKLLLARLSRFEVLSTRKSFKIKPRTQKVFTTSYWLPSSAAAVTRGGGWLGSWSLS